METPQPPQLVFQHITVSTIKLNLPCHSASLLISPALDSCKLCSIYTVEDNLVTVILSYQQVNVKLYLNIPDKTDEVRKELG